jgi:hypothetical protein
MRLITHYVFSFSATLLLLILFYKQLSGFMGYTGIDEPAANGALATRTLIAAIALWLSIAVNFIIDRVGHNRLNFGGRRGIPVRAWRTHSIYTAPLWGALIGVGTVIVAALVQANSHLNVLIDRELHPNLLLSYGLLGMYVSYTHLFLDSLTEGGVYTKRHKRIAIAHFKYNNAAINFATILASLGIVYYTWYHPLP